MKRERKEVSQALQEFLDFVEQCRNSYQAAYDAVGLEDNRLQDLLHSLEFAEGENAKRRAGTALQQSRQERRKQKDEVMRMKPVVEFFNEPANKGTLNRMRQLLGRQRKEEEYLDSKRVYRPRVPDQTKVK